MNTPYQQNPQFPFLYPGAYSPGQVAFQDNAELSHLISMFSGPLLGAMAGPGNFVPSMFPVQAQADQFAMRNYQNQTRAAAFAVAPDNTNAVANRLLAMRSAVTKEAPTELNRQQAGQMAEMINNPMVKSIAGMILGPERVESILHGSKGDVSALQNTIAKIGYFRPDPSGLGRIDAESQASFSRGLYAHMYEPQGNLDQIEEEARSDNEEIREKGRTRLKKAAKKENVSIVDDEEILTRLETMDNAPEKIDSLYKKYVQGGKATDTKQQAQELLKFDRAIAASGQLRDNEATVGQLRSKANRAPTDEMHGFMAGQVGQITENMFQRGLLPQSVGSMSAADRARMINKTELDQETKDRLSREMARKDLESTTNTSDKAKQFRALTSEIDRERFIEQEKDTYGIKLENTRKEIAKTAVGADGAMSATDLEKLQGFDSLASNVDAKRSSEVIKQYTGAVAAIRDIFGDNGNPNAPLPALLAALEGLTGGAVGSMKPQKIEATLRQMQTLAKEAGIGYDQMANMSTQIDSMGQALGLTPADTLRVKADTMAAVKVMQDTGAFSNPVYGQVDKGTATARAGELITRGAGSRNSRAMAALESIYQADVDPKTGKSKRFAGTELEAALKAYRDNEGDGTYVDPNTGETKNIRQLIGRYGVAGATGVLENSGGNMAEFTSQINNPAVMQFSNEKFGFLTQKEEIIRDITAGDAQSRVMSRLENTSIMDGLDAESRATVGSQIGDVMTRMVVDNSDLAINDQITYIQDNIEQELKNEFSKTMPEEEAAAKAKEAAAAMGDRSSINEFIGGANTVYAARTGGRQLSENAQYRAKNRDAKIAAEAARSEKRAVRRAEVGLGLEGTPAGRISDYMLDIGEKGESFNADEFVKAMAPTISDREVLDRYAKDMSGGFDELVAMRRDAFVTNADVDQLVKEKDTAGLRKLAGIADGVELVSDEETAQLKEQKIEAATKDNARTLAMYKRYTSGGKNYDADKMTEEQRTNMIQELRQNKQFNEDMTREALGDNRITNAQIEERARAQVGSAEKGKEQLAEDVNKIQRAMLGGRDEDMLREGVYATFRAVGASLSDDQAKAIHDAVKDTTPDGQKKLTDVIGQLDLTDEKREKMTKLLTAQQAGISADVANTLGITQIPDKELTQQIAKQFEAQGMSAEQAEKKAQEVKADVDKQKTEAAASGQTPAQEAGKDSGATTKQIETALKKQYEAEGLSAEDAQKKATETAAAVAASAEKDATGVSQRVDTLEVNAQTVVIKSGKLDGADSAASGGKKPAGDAAAAPPAMKLPDNIKDVQKEIDTLTAKMKPTSFAGRIFGYGDTYFADKADEKRFAQLALRKKELQTQNGNTEEIEQKKDSQLVAPETAPKPAAPEPEKVQQASDQQLKHDTGNTTAQPADKPAEQPTQSPPANEKETEYAAPTDPIREQYATKVSEYQKELDIAKETGNYDDEEFSQAFFDQAQKELNAYDAAKASGISWNANGKNNWTTRGNAPVKVNGKDVNPTALSQEQRDSVIAAINMSAQMSGDMPAADRDMLAKYVAANDIGAQEQKQATQAKQAKDTVTENQLPTDVPPSMAAVIDREKADPAEQAVLQGSTALYEKYTPTSEKTSELKSEPEKPKLNAEQMRLQEVYWNNQKRVTGATTDVEKKYAQEDTQRALRLMGIHNAAQEAGIDTRHGALYDPATQTINGKKIDTAKVEEHVAKLKEKAASDPESVISPSVKKRLKIKQDVKEKNETEFKQNAGVSSANVDPAVAAASIAQPSGYRLDGGPPRGSFDEPSQKYLTNGWGPGFGPDVDYGTGFNTGPTPRLGGKELGPTLPAGDDIAPTISKAGEALAESLGVATPLSQALPDNRIATPDKNNFYAIPASGNLDQTPQQSAGVAHVPSTGQSTMTINGTLSLSGLQEAIMSAQGSQVMETEGGAPVIVDPSTAPRPGAPPRTYG